MNWHWVFQVLVLVGAWCITQTESSINTAVENEESEDRLKLRSARALFGSSRKNKTETTTAAFVIKYPVTTARSNYGWRIFATTGKPRATISQTKSLGWNIPTTTRPVAAATKRWTTKRPLITTTRHWRKNPKNSTDTMGWVITTTPRSMQTTRKPKDIFGWDISTTKTTTRPLLNQKNHSDQNVGMTASTQSTFNATHHIGRGIPTTTLKPLTKTRHRPNQANWNVPLSTTALTNVGWIPTTTRALPVTTWPAPITTKKYSRIFGERHTTTKSPPAQKSTKFIQPRLTTQNPFGGHGRRNFTSPNVGEWKTLAPLNSQQLRPHEPVGDSHQCSIINITIVLRAQYMCKDRM